MTTLPIQLPNGFVPCVGVGDQITVGQVIAIKKTREEEIINIPKQLAIRLSQVKNVLKKIPGEGVSIGDILAVKKSFFRTKSIILRSRVSGTVTRYERDSGNLVIKTNSDTPPDIKNLISPVEGKVSICNNREIVIETDKNAIIGTKASGGKVTGDLYQLEADDPYHMDARTIGKIVIGGILTREMLLKGIGIGVAGLIGVQIEDDDIAHIEEKNFQTPIIQITKDDKNRLMEWKGKKVFLDAEAKSIIFLHS